MPGENLTRAEARERAELIQVDSYQVDLDLTQGPKIFTARTEVTFTAATPGASTFIDLIADRVRTITLNDEALDPATHFAQSRVALPNLATNNTLVIESDQLYMNTGEGLHRFEDPADGEVYLYSQFEVPDSRRMFAVFEQPDLKATFQFTVTAPARWQVVSNQPTPEPVDAGTAGEQADRPGEAIATWKFSPTPVMSSYITALIAGPYAVQRFEHTNTEGRTIPMGIFCRESLFEHLDAEYIFEKTVEGFNFFEKEFDYPYPFEKYDQLFVPEFNMGAMENIGAVTHTEAYVFRGQVTDAMRERRVVTVLHELAHMWFGDLVTMQWWNDLWLNESFAEYMSTLATAEATEWTECWTTFAASEKSWAYRQDQLPSTHPVYAEVNDLEDVLTNFDGITYAKGASVLKALVSYVGRESFMQGVHNYFTKHAYKNTVFDDLLAELQATSGRDLQEWSQKWIKTHSPNTLRADFDVDDNGVFTRFEIVQTAPESGPTLRPHRIAIGEYSLSDNRVERSHRIELDVAATERTPVTEMVGRARPDFLLINDDDLTFAKIRLDDASAKFAQEHLSKFADSLARTLIWTTLWDEVRDAERPAQDFIHAVAQHIGSETASTTLRTVLGQVHTAVSLYLPEQDRERTTADLAAALWQHVDAFTGGDVQFQLLLSAMGLTTDDAELARIAGLLDGTVTLPGVTVDQDLRWNLLTALARNGRIEASRIDTELDQDETATGRQAAAKARAAIGTPDAKQRAWDSVFEEESPVNLIVRYTGVGFQAVNDPALLRPFVALYFDSVDNVWDAHSFAIASEILEGFYPIELAGPELAQATQAWLDAHSDAAPALRRILIEHLADVERAVNAQNCAVARA